MRSNLKPNNIKTIVLALASVGLVSLPAHTALANPVDGKLVAGNVTIQQESATKLGIVQTSNKAIVDWKSFSIGANEHTQFYQPSASAVILNRVVGEDPSQILGRLTANGQVFLVNPNGIFFGKNAQIDVASLVASTHNIRNEDFLAGNYNFNIPGKPGASVINEGTIRIADTGIAAFVAPSVANRSVIVARLGKVALAAANGFTLDFQGDQLLSFLVGDEVAQTAFDIEGKQLSSFLENSGRIEANGGYVLLTAKAAEGAIHSVINQSGSIEARTVENRKGEILLLGGKHGTVKIDGQLDASALDSGDGGFVETSGADVRIADTTRVTTAAQYGKTGTWLIDPNDYTIAASGGNITGAALSSNLGSTSVTISTATQGTAGGNGDIFVNDAVSWSANNTLTLSAERYIEVNANITATGNTAGLVLTPGIGAIYSLNNGAAITLSGTNPSLTIAGHAYTVINSLGTAGDTSGATLQGMSGNLSGYYALGSSINASATSGWNSGAGFTPVGGDNNVPYLGTFDGLGHTISSLVINRPSTDYAGLFGYIGNSGNVKNAGLIGGSVHGNGWVGGLAGVSEGHIDSSFATGDVSGSTLVGGLVGMNLGAVDSSYANGNVSASVQVAGGLVGWSAFGRTISNSHATGNVSAPLYVGGLAGVSHTINNSYATGNVSGGSLVGGLAGTVSGTISNSYAAGNVSASGDNVGGLAGYIDSGVSTSYATGGVTGGTSVGGLVGGSNGGSISTSYATGKVVGLGQVGGLVGIITNSGTVDSSYWNSSVNVTGIGINIGGGMATATGLTTTELKQLSSFVGWDIADVGSAGKNWRIYEGSTTPLLTSFLKPLTISADAVSAVYTGTAYSGALVNPVYSPSSPDFAHLLGNSYRNATNAGTYAPAKYSDQQGYDISYVNGLLTITKAPLTATANAASKTYDGLAYSGGNGVAYSGFVNSESAGVLGGTLAYSGTSQGAVNAGSYVITPGGLTSGNYNISYVDGALTINSASLTLATVTANNASKTYGTTLVFNGAGFTPVGLVGGDTIDSVTLTSAGAAATANAATYAIVPSNAHFSVGSASNYSISYVNGVLTVNKAPLTVTANSLTQGYDGLPFSGGNGVAYSGFVNSQTASVLGGAMVYGGNSQGALNAGSYVIAPSGLTSVNYTISYVNGMLTISSAASTTTNGNATVLTGNSDLLNQFTNTAGSTPSTSFNPTISLAALTMQSGINEAYQGDVATMQKIAKYADYAVLANNAYTDETYAALPSPEYARVAREVGSYNGFQAVAYMNRNTGEVTVSFRGTEPLGAPDGNKNWTQDLGIALGGLWSAGIFEQAVAFANRITKAIADGQNVEGSEFFGAKALNFTGHSLGGALATYAALRTGNDAITFNSAPLGLIQMGAVGVAELTALAKTGNSSMVNFKSTNDPLTFVDKPWLVGETTVVQNASGGHNMTSLMNAMHDVQTVAPSLTVPNLSPSISVSDF
ncbi:MAG: MBG domain-containing protein [Sulfuritalea sp.]|nr:MBG domain-containing protein [Sulfuritalea sp.]MDP1984034.1 MBG domain-containing protein [Sulfuritalea sp.]